MKSGRRVGIRALTLTGIIGLVVALSSVGFFLWSANEVSTTRELLKTAEQGYQLKIEAAEQEKEARDKAEAAEREKKRVAAESAARQDKNYADQGYVKVADGIYAYFFDPSSFSCGNWNCAFVQFATEKACPNHLYVEVSWDRDGTSIGWSNAVSTALSAGDTWLAEFNDTSNQGDTYRITSVSCR